MPTDLPPYREPLCTTLLRTCAIAAAIGAVAMFRGPGGMTRWAPASLLALWPALGGHFVELAYLNRIRQRLPNRRVVHVAARLATWFAGGVFLLFAMRATAAVMARFAPAATPPPRWPPWWVGGVAFIVIELIAHLVMHLRGRPSFYDGRG